MARPKLRITSSEPSTLTVGPTSAANGVTTVPFALLKVAGESTPTFTNNQTAAMIVIVATAATLPRPQARPPGSRGKMTGPYVATKKCDKKVAERIPTIEPSAAGVKVGALPPPVRLRH